MSAPREGMHLAKEAQEMTDVMRDGTYTSLKPTDKIQGGAGAAIFQRKFDAKDKYDDYMNTKMQLMDDEGMTPFGQTFYSDKDARWLERKAAVSEAANFDAYFGREFNKNDLASRQWAQRINPDWYQSRIDQMKTKVDVALKLKQIQLRGPQSKEDLYMQWLIESGRVKLPADWDRIGPAFDGDADDLKDQQKSTYDASLIRFPLFLTNKQRKKRAGQNDAVGAWGSKKEAQNIFSNGQPNAKKGVKNGPLARPGDKKNGTLSRGFLTYLDESNQPNF